MCVQACKESTLSVQGSCIEHASVQGAFTQGPRPCASTRPAPTRGACRGSPPSPLRSVAVTHSEDIPPFGPPLPPSGTRLPHTPALRAFLLAKAINAENAAERAGRFHALAARTRAQYLQDLARAHATTAGLEAAASARRGPRLMPRRRGAEAGGHPDALLGALTWRVRAGDPEAGGPERPCRLGVSAERLVLVGTEGVLFHCSCHDVLAWAFTGEATLDLYYGPGRYLRLHLPPARPQDARAIVRRLQVGMAVGCGGKMRALWGHA